MSSRCLVGITMELFRREYLIVVHLVLALLVSVLIISKSQTIVKISLHVFNICYDCIKSFSESCCRSSFIRHVSYNHHLLEWMVRMKPENFIVNFTSSKFYKDFVELHPNLLHQEANFTQAINTYVGSFTPKKYSSPGKTNHKELAYGELRSPAHQSFRTPEKRNQNRMVIFNFSTTPINPCN